MLLLLSAHPYPDRSRANRALLTATRGLERVHVHSLYDLYPDFGIDVRRERELLVEASVIVWQHPLYWYSVPGLLKHWFDKVLTRGFAYGEGGVALCGKKCLWVPTTGGEPSAFSETGMHGRPFEEFVPVIEQTAKFCGMQWEPPFVVHGAHRISEEAMAERVAAYKTTLQELLDAVPVSASVVEVAS